ncbi:rpl7 (nucleomorph) [Hemiselmis andersenii]|uniref:Rpl7 n=1 Tax=Hemiselmis andersenii TaxID=464988 RepID=A9BKE3_HEMAN|nr:rpl7 [Hemiselmis andersenii]ABW97976.1 rpl7 [Hemiselmis andersenii]|mmetsp:Transcript_29430/g.68767  ORF Transcript_29430/g.68767 Transcript_29430/m.68767 type:complete len:248 (+) Transcript_29430:435-1178(+)
MYIEAYVPKGIEKKKKFIETLTNENNKLKIKEKNNNIRSKKYRLTQSEKYIKENIKRKKSFIEENRLAKKKNKFIIPAKAKIFFVIRIRGINGVSPRAKKILELLRLNQINSGVFLKVNSSTNQMLKKIEPFVAYGYPSLKNIKNLIKKRGFGKIGKRGSWQRKNLSENGIIEQGLSNIGVFNLEEIIHEIYNCGTRFREINNFLWPFKLKSPKKGYSNIGKNKHFVEGGAYGNWEESINNLILKMN